MTTKRWKLLIKVKKYLRTLKYFLRCISRSLNFQRSYRFYPPKTLFYGIGGSNIKCFFFTQIYQYYSVQNLFSLSSFKCFRIIFIKEKFKFIWHERLLDLLLQYLFEKTKIFYRYKRIPLTSIHQNRKKLRFFRKWSFILHKYLGLISTKFGVPVYIFHSKKKIPS